jgi:hypothetical protein
MTETRINLLTLLASFISFLVCLSSVTGSLITALNLIGQCMFRTSTPEFPDPYMLVGS